MKLAIISLIVGNAAAFVPAPSMSKTSSSSLNAFSFSKFANSLAPSTPDVKDSSFTIENMPGALAPMGFWDPLGFAAKADDRAMKRYREAEITHGRVAMLAVLGFLVGEAVEGSSFLFDASISGPAIEHFPQVPVWADLLAATFIGAAEAQRAEIGWVDPSDAAYDQPGQLRDDYYPGDLGFDPLGIKPEDPEELNLMITRELQNGRLAMLAAAGFLAQETVDGLGIFEHFRVSMIESADFGL